MEVDMAQSGNECLRPRENLTQQVGYLHSARSQALNPATHKIDFARACMHLARIHRLSQGLPFKAAGALLGAILSLSVSSAGALAAEDLSLELNKLETVKTACQAYFVIEEKAGKPLQSLKTDLIIFGKDGGIARRLIAEMGPVRSKKTSVKIFAIDVACPEISGVLLNDVASCAPEAGPEACLDRLAISSRLNVRFYK
jgi:hypothetical protein